MKFFLKGWFLGMVTGYLILAVMCLLDGLPIKPSLVLPLIPTLICLVYFGFIFFLLRK